MINVFNSTSKRTSSTTQTLLDDLVYESGYPRTEWANIVEESDHVSELWITSKIYLSKDSQGKLVISHNNGESVTTSTFTAVMSKYLIVVTDYGLLVIDTSSSYSLFLAIGKTTNPQGGLSHGAIFRYQNNSTILVYTDNITTSSASLGINAVGKAEVNTVLVPLYSITGDEHFDDIMFVLQSKSTDSGKISLNNSYYYIYSTVALPYTEE